MEQEIRFCTAPDGARIAYATVGEGPPLVKAANWLNHLEFDWESPVWRHVFREFTRDHRLVRYDARGNGLSDWDVADLSFEKLVTDLETVVDAAGLDRFTLLGISQGCAVSVAYAVRHPERVERMVFIGGYPVGWGGGGSERRERQQAMMALARTGWGSESPAFRQMFSSLYLPEGTAEELSWFNDLQRKTTSPENAVRLMEVLGAIDVRELLPQVQVPTLVMHVRGDAAVPFEAGRALAAGIPAARFVGLDGNNHLILEREPAWRKCLTELRAFLGVTSPAGDAADRFLSTGGALAGALGRDVVESAADISAAPEDLAETVALGLPGWLASGHLLADRYRLQRQIGQGAMGAVFLARDTTLERDVAVKIASGAGIDRAWRTRALREARAAAALNHPNIIAVHDVGEEQGTAFMVMEYVAGPTLEDTPPRSVDEALRIAITICDALDHAHRRGLVHRDLKPANLLLVRDDDGCDVKLADLGIALGVEDSRITATGNIVGTPRYMAPEQALAEEIDARADLYALGAMLYEWLTGRPPFVGDTPLSVVGKHIHAVAKPPSERLPDLPRDLDAIVLKLLEKKPDDRYASAKALKCALEAVRAR